MLSKHLSIGGVILISTLLASLSVQAQPDQLYEHVGVLDAKYSEKDTCVIYDVEFYCPPNTPVFVFDPNIDNTDSELRKPASLKSLTPGTPLGYKVLYKENSRQGQIIEMWKLPRGILKAFDEER